MKSTETETLSLDLAAAEDDHGGLALAGPARYLMGELRFREPRRRSFDGRAEADFQEPWHLQRFETPFLLPPWLGRGKLIQSDADRGQLSVHKCKQRQRQAGAIMAEFRAKVFHWRSPFGGYETEASFIRDFYRVDLVEGHPRCQDAPGELPLRLLVHSEHRLRTTGSISSEKIGGTAWRTEHRSAARPQTEHPCDGEWYEIQNRFSGLDLRAEVKKFQIFVKSITGKPRLLWVSAEDTGESLKNMIVKLEGYPHSSFYLLHEGKVLHEGDRMRDYQIGQSSTLHVMHRMRGGLPGRTAGPSAYKEAAGSKGPQTYKDAARSKGPQAEASTNVQPSPYIVEKLESTPVLEIKNQQVQGLFNDLQNQAVICRFNGFWPRSHELHAWIYQNWTANCQLLLCSKGFFVVQFESMDDYQKVFLQGPWFWGRAGLFITPWFPEFDANTMTVTKMPVWVRLPNLPLPYWHHQVLEDIGNLLGNFIKSDKERQDKGLFTYARICVEIDLSKGLPDRMHLKHESHIWLQQLDYENTAFRCRYCQLTGHLQDSCPLAKKFPKNKKGTRKNRKNWQADYVPSSEEEEGSEEEDQQEEPREEETMVSDDGKAQTTGSQTTGGDTQTNMENRVDALARSKKHTEDSLSDKGIQTAIVIHEEAPSSGIKRGHESGKSDSDKELPAKQKPEMVNGRQVVVATSSQGRWVEVKNKRKGKKGRIEAYFQP